MKPKLRFREFGDTWKRVRLDNVANFRRGSFPQPYGLPKWYDENGLPFIQVFDVDDNMLLKSSTKSKISKLAAEQSVFVKKGTLVLTIQGSIGRIAITQYDAYVDRTLLIFQSYKTDVDVNFFKNLIFLLFEIEKQKAPGGTIKTITKEALSSFVISVPSFPEQQKIASFLSAVDEKIRQLKRKKKLQEQYKKGVMQQIFERKIRFKDEKGKEFPEWEEKRLGDVAEKNKTKNRDGKIEFVLTNSATQGIVGQQDYFERQIVTASNLEGYYVVEVDDFVYNPRVSVSAPVGPIKRNKLQKGAMSPLYSVFRFKKGNLHYYEFFFETTGWHDYLENVANIGVRHDRMNISTKDFYSMPIPYPCLEEQQKIASFLSSLDKKIELVSQQVQKAQEFKKGLLQQMFV